MIKRLIGLIAIFPLLIIGVPSVEEEPVPTAAPAVIERPKEISRATVRAPLGEIESETIFTKVIAPPPPPKPKPKVTKKATKTRRASTGGGSAPAGIASCIAKYESGGNPRAENPVSTASGLYQIIDGTWGGYKGYARASDAPASIQTERFYQLWDSGRGSRNWVVSPKCGYAGYYSD